MHSSRLVAENQMVVHTLACLPPPSVELIQDLRPCSSSEASGSDSQDEMFQSWKHLPHLQQVCQRRRAAKRAHQRIYSHAKFHNHGRKETDLEVKPGSLVKGARSQEPGARNQEPGARTQKPGPRTQDPGANSMAYLQACFHFSPAVLKFDDVTMQSNPQMLLFLILIMQVAIKNIIWSVQSPD